MIMQREELFLATTALEDFWDKESKILFLGEWCLLYDRMHAWQSLNYEVLDYPWDNRYKMLKAHNFCQALYENMLPFFKDQLNIIHGTTHDIRYWEIIIGPWLIRYIHALYDRYICVKKAIKITRHLRTITLSETCFISPFDFHHFGTLCIDDLFNLQLYSQVCDYFQIKSDKVQKEEVKITKNAIKKIKWLRSSRRILITSLKYFVSSTSTVHFKINRGCTPYWAIDIYAPLREKFFIRKALKNKLLILDIKNIENKLKRLKGSISINDEIRNVIVKNGLRYFGKDDFTKFLVITLKQNLPVMYIEGYYDAMKVVRNYISKRPRALLTATGFHSSTLYPFIAANTSEGGTKLITIQHGGSFGATEVSPMEYFDQKVSDEYWSWGWENGLNKKCRPMPSLIIKNIKGGIRHSE